MITKLTLSNVASYKNIAQLELKNRVNLIYGLNGTGKSTLSNFLYNITDEDFSECKIEYSSTDYEILVYNQKFINDTFFEPENLNGIFTLSKENKDAEKKIENANKELKNLNSQIATKKSEILLLQEELANINTDTKNTVWKIKKDYSGGDRVLEFCLDGLKSDGQKLLNHIESFSRPLTKPVKTIDELKIEAQEVSGDNINKIDLIDKIALNVTTK